MTSAFDGIMVMVFSGNFDEPIAVVIGIKIQNALWAGFRNKKCETFFERWRCLVVAFYSC